MPLQDADTKVVSASEAGKRVGQGVWKNVQEDQRTAGVLDALQAVLGNIWVLADVLGGRGRALEEEEDHRSHRAHRREVAGSLV